MRCMANRSGARSRARDCATDVARLRSAAALTFCAVILLCPLLRARGPAVGAMVEAVSIAVPNGEPLDGQYRDAGRGAPGVLLFPMCGPRGVDGWRPVAERLHAAGVSSLMVAEPGYGPNGARQARADAAFAYLGSRLGEGTPTALTGGSCGVALALSTASRHPGRVGAVVVVSGPYSDEQIEYVRKSPSLAVFSGASEAEPPSPEWARALKQASANPASRVEIWTARAHGTEYFAVNPAFAEQVTVWLVERLTAGSRREK